MFLLPLLYLAARNHHFLFGPSLKGSEVLRAAHHPLVSYKGICRPNIKRVIADGNPAIFYPGFSKPVGPIINMVDLHAAAAGHNGRSLWSRWKRRDQELLVIWNHPLKAITSAFQTGLECLPGTLSQRWMLDRVVNLIEVFGGPLVELAKGPGRQRLRIDRSCHLANIARDLRVASKIMDELCVGGSE